MYIQYVCRYGIGCPNLDYLFIYFSTKLIGQSQLAGDACPACRAQPELPSIILLLIEVPKLGNKEIHTYIKYQLGSGLGAYRTLYLQGWEGSRVMSVWCTPNARFPKSYAGGKIQN